jgi:hypothetical protein
LKNSSGAEADKCFQPLFRPASQHAEKSTYKSKTIPRRLKPHVFLATYGMAEAMPFP